MASLIAIPFLIGSVPLGLAVVGANHFLKDKRKTNKFLYWGGITASAFGGWVVSNMLMTRYVESEVLSAENSDKNKLTTRLIVAIDTSASTVMDYKGRFGMHYHPATKNREYPLAKKYETMAKNMVKILQPDDVVVLDWNGQGVTYYDETKQSYNGTGSYKSIADFIREEGLDRGDFVTTTVTITDAPMASFREFRAEYGFDADSKFKQPLYTKDGLDFGRDTKGRFRRKLVTPITNTEYEKGMLTKRIIPTPSNPSNPSPPLELDLFDDGAFTEIEDITPPFKPSQYFYRWIGGASGNPIYYGYPDIKGMNSLVHYVHPIYDEAYVKTLVNKLNEIDAYND
jgi:hypothetical protein